MPLTDRQIKNAKPADKAYKLTDGSVLYSELTKTSTALPRLAVLSVLSEARRLVLIFVNSLYMDLCVD